MINQDTIEFIKSLYPEYSEIVPLHVPVFLGNEKKYLNQCIDTTFVSSVGKFVDRFEDEVVKFTGAEKAVVCVNGTNALHLSLLLNGVEQDDEVITQPLTFIATVNAISYCNAHPIFCDVDEDTMGLSPFAVRKWLESHAEIRTGKCYNQNTKRRISAILPMHTFGHPVKLDEFILLCEEWKLTLIEDAAESIGSYYKGRHTGLFGKVSALSFNGNKTITTGGGGMLLFTDKELGERAKHLTTQAKIPHRWEFKHDAIGYNYRMPNINAALGCAQMEYINKILDNKRQTAMKYKEFFAGTNIRFFDEPAECKSNFWLNAILLPNKEEQLRFLKESNDANVQARPIWELMNRLNMFKTCEHDDLKNAIMFADRVVNIPSGYRK
jgi:aminotransferase in exopolysaccharide biosynthesis